MSSLLRHAVLLALSAWVSWWFFLRVPAAPAGPAGEPSAAITVVPLLRDPVPELVSVPMPAPRADQLLAPADDGARAEEQTSEPEPAAAERTPPPPELGTPEGEEELEAPTTAPESFAEELAEADVELDAQAMEAPDPTHADGEQGLTADPASSAERAAVEARMHDPTLLAAAEDELARGNKKGFATVLLSSPEDQLDIARFFGEELVLVPRSALDPANAAPSYFRLAPAASAVERVEGAPPLEDHRQYRDLFDYEYARLPGALRELRRSVVARDGVYLFAALLSAGEWALVIARRGEALARSERELGEVRRFVLRYVPLADGAWDLRTEEIVFTDGTRFVPDPSKE